MSVLNTLRFLTHHPLCRDRKARTLARWFAWQVGSRLVPGPVAVPFVNGSRLLVARGMTGATGNLYTGLHEFEEMAFVLHLLRGSDLFVDVGANVGAYTVMAASLGARVISVEPIPQTFAHLQRNVSLNQATDRVTLQNCGLGAAPGVLRFTSGGDTVNHVLSENERTTPDAVEVEVKTLDALLQDVQPRLMKIDAEGYETNIIRGGEKALQRPSLDAIIMELNGSGTRYGFDEAKLFQQILAMGFAPFTYVPFERKLISQQSTNGDSGNVLFVRNVAQVQDRLRSAPPFRVDLSGREV